MRTFGIEIETRAPSTTERFNSNNGHHVVADMVTNVDECDGYLGYTHRVSRSAWKVVLDASDGSRPLSEVVSPILTGDEAGLDRLRKVADALHTGGCKVDRFCGVHVHVGVSDLTPSQLKNVARAWIKHESVIFSILPASRRRNVYSANNTNGRDIGTLLNTLARMVDTQGRLANVAGPNGKFSALNFDKLRSYGTLEFRCHSGSIESKKLVAWARFCIAFVETFKDGKPSNRTGSVKPFRAFALGTTLADATTAMLNKMNKKAGDLWGRTQNNYFRNRQNMFAALNRTIVG